MPLIPVRVALALSICMLCMSFPLHAQSLDEVHRLVQADEYLETFRDPGAREGARMRALDELGRWGSQDVVNDLRQGLDLHESPDIRIATMRAMMRLNPDAAQADIFKQVLGDTDVTNREMDWAIRALGRSGNAKAVVPQLMRYLKAPEAGTRSATVDSLRRLTGMTMGASQTNLLFPVAEDATLDEYVERWQKWWDENNELGPEQWRIAALNGQLPIDRATAARAIAANDQRDAIPALIERLQKEPASGVREALASALGNLTGISARSYSAYRPQGMSEDEWEIQHLDFIRSLKKTYESFKEGEGDPLLAHLLDDNARTRLDALINLRLRDDQEEPLGEYVKRLRDTSSAVAERAHQNLIAAIGVSWPFDPAGPADEREVQIRRWQDWIREHVTREARLLSVFRPREHMSWGMAAVEGELRKRAEAELDRALPGIRSRVAAYLSTASGLEVNTEQLREAFRRENLTLREVIQARRWTDQQISSGLQRHLALAFGNLEDKEALSLLLERVRIADQARRLDLGASVLAVATDPGVIAACVQTLGQIEARSAADELRTMLDEANEPSLRVRAQAAIALARIGDDLAAQELVDMFDREESQYTQSAAAQALAMLAQKKSEIRPAVIRILERASLDRATLDKSGQPSGARYRAKEVRDTCRALLRFLR